MGFIGYNDEEIITSIKGVQSAYEDLIKAIADDMQNLFVNGMEDKWACTYAQTFFADFKNLVDTLIKDSNDTFQSVVDSMNSAANGWAENTGTPWSSKQFVRLDKSIDVSRIKENINGDRGADPDVTEVAGKLSGIASAAVTALTNAESAVQVCGFIGGDSASNLIASLGKIKTSIENAVNEITSECQKAIETTNQNYTSHELNVAGAFAGSK